NASNILTGIWGNGDSFDIQLVNDTGVECNLLDNFDFILVPEPATLALLGFGGLWVRKRRKL
ncbi:MAG: PEP-CTERM sorting domain-containing protein, partial [Phycisphaerae bacterium]|nr:PEP-CTERM sorting domain-containing protein [Phycisphaerae bacterium]